MLRVGHPSNGTPLLGLVCATSLISLPPPLYVSLVSLKNIVPLARPSHASQRRAAVSPHHSAFAAAAISPRVPSSCTARSSLLPVVHPRCASRSLLLQSHPPRAYPRRRAGCPPLLVRVVPLRASSQSPLIQGHPQAQPMLMVLARCRSASPSTLRPESTGPGLSLPLCCKCIFQVFQMLS